MGASEPRFPWHAALAISACATIFTAMQGLTYPLLAILLDRAGASAWVIGVNAATMPLGMVLSAWLAPRLFSRLSGFPLAAASLFGTAASMLLIGAIGTRAPELWMPLRLLMGFCVGNVLIVTETWINEVTADQYRGRVLGAYSAFLSVGFALGPGLLVLVGTEGWTPFLLGALFPLAALAVLTPMRSGLPGRPADKKPLSALQFFPLAPLLVLCAGVVAFADEGSMSLLPIYLIQHGYGEQAGNLALVAMIAGSVSMQFPIGWLADRLPRTRVMAGTATVAALSAALLPLAVHAPIPFAALVFVWGGAYYALYVLSLIRLGELFKGSALVAGNAAFGAMWGVGGIAGPAALGAVMSGVGPVGFPLTFALVFGAVALAVALLGNRAGKAANEN